MTSLTPVTSSPADLSERIAASLPAPGPFIHASTFFIPISITSLAQRSAACCAAKGVLLRDPLNPMVPGLAHETTLPFWSVMVMSVLLNVDRMCTMPATSNFFIFFFLLIRFGLAKMSSYFFFLPAPGLALGPLRVRALVLVL